MSKDNVEIVRQLYECVSQRRWDRMAELLDPDVAQLYDRERDACV